MRPSAFWRRGCQPRRQRSPLGAVYRLRLPLQEQRRPSKVWQASHSNALGREADNDYFQGNRGTQGTPRSSKELPRNSRNSLFLTPKVVLFTSKMEPESTLEPSQKLLFAFFLHVPVSAPFSETKTRPKEGFHAILASLNPLDSSQIMVFARKNSFRRKFDPEAAPRVSSNPKAKPKGWKSDPEGSRETFFFRTIF